MLIPRHPDIRYRRQADTSTMKRSLSRSFGAVVPDRRGFTLIELIAVIVVLAVLAGVALPVYFDWSDEAEESAAAYSIGGIRTALNDTFTNHRVTNAPSSEWVASLNDIAGTMLDQRLPEGVTIVSGQLLVQNDDLYDFTAETNSEPARLVLDTGGGGSTSPSIIAILLANWLGRRRAKALKADSHAPDHHAA